MRVLIDEHFDVRLFRLFEKDFEAETVEYRGWKGVGNGALLQRASEEYDAFLTNDQGIPHQQWLHDLGLRVVVLEVPSAPTEGRKCPWGAMSLKTPSHSCRKYVKRFAKCSRARCAAWGSRELQVAGLFVIF